MLTPLRQSVLRYNISVKPSIVDNTIVETLTKVVRRFVLFVVQLRIDIAATRIPKATPVSRTQQNGLRFYPDDLERR